MKRFRAALKREWFRARCGSLGASQIADALARTKTGWGASRANVMAQLAVERLTGVPTEGFTTAAMQWGIDTEPQARTAYSFMTNADVQEVGLIIHPRINGTHASPDGLIGEDGVLEIKCAQAAAHLDVLLSEKVPDKYQKQAVWQLACSGRQYADVVYYNPTFPASMQMWTTRINRDEALVDQLEAEVRLFLKELEGKVEELKRRYELEAA